MDIFLINLSFLASVLLFSFLLCTLFDEIEEKNPREERREKELDKRSLQYIIPDPDSGYNLLFQEVIPVNLSYSAPKKAKIRKLKKIPLRFQEVIEVTTQSTSHSVKSQAAEIKEIKRYSIEELERQFPEILNEESNDLLQNYPYDEVYEVKKLPTRFTPSQSVRRVKPVYNSYRNKLREFQANRGILREVNLGPNKFKRHQSYYTAGSKSEETKKESLFDQLSARSPGQDPTQIIISLTNNPHIKVYNGRTGQSSPVGPPAPPPSGRVTRSPRHLRIKIFFGFQIFQSIPPRVLHQEDRPSPRA